MLAALRGPRRGEIAGLRWEDVDLLVNREDQRLFRGSRYSPTTSRTLSMNCGSLDSSKVSTRCGLSPKVFHIRPMVDFDSPDCAAIDVRDQCVALAGVASNVLTITSSTCSSVIFLGAPGRGSSAKPANRRSRKRLRRLVTVCGQIPNSAATSWLARNPLSSAQPNTIRHRNANACDDFARRDQRTSVAVVVLSQYVQAEYASVLLDSGDGRHVGYLLKDCVADVAEFAETLRRVAAGGAAIDPDVVRHLLHRPRDPLAALSAREREVLALLAEGHSNTAIAAKLYVAEAATGKHVGNILTKLDLPPSDDTNRRVLAVLTYLRTGPSR